MDPTAPPPSNPNYKGDEVGYPPDKQEVSQPPPYTDPAQAYPPQQAGYPQSTYPQQQPAPYPQQQPAAYPSQQHPGYPHQHANYPPQEGYAQQQTAYPLNAPPPAYYPQQAPPAPQTQQQQHSVVVVQQQPQVVQRPVVYHQSDLGNPAMIFAIIVTMFLLFGGCWFAWVCSIPAILFASNATSAGNRGDSVAAKRNVNLSYGFTIGAIVSAVLIPTMFFGIYFGIILG